MLYEVSKRVGPTRLVSRIAARERLGDSNSVFYRGIKGGLIPKLVKRGRSSYLAEHEIDAVIAARSQGLTDDEIRELVAALHTARANALAELGITREPQAA